MRIIKVEPYKEPEIAEIKGDLESLQQTVGGYIQAVYPFQDEVAIVCNDEGKINGLEMNRALSSYGEIYDIIHGTFFICGLGEENFDDIPKELEEKYMTKCRRFIIEIQEATDV